MPAHPSSTDLASIVAAQMRSVQSEDVDWISLPLTATPTKISDILFDPAGVNLQDRWDRTPQECMEQITAIVFLAQDARPLVELRTFAADAVYAEAAAGFDIYIPAVRIFDKFASVAAPDTAMIAIHCNLPVRGS